MSERSSASSNPLQGKVLGATLGPISALGVVQDIVGLGKEWLSVHEVEMTKRAGIRSDAEVKIAEIQERRDLFLTYLDKAFDEREEQFRALFKGLDNALVSNSDAVGPLLSSISTLALKSPFSDLRDPELLRQKLGDPDAEWKV